MREFLAHRKAEAERLVVAERIIPVIVFQLRHRAVGTAYKYVGHHQVGAAPP